MRFAPKNPYVLAPMTTYSSLPSGELSPDEEPFLESRAKGGFGTIITAACAVHPSGKAFHGQWCCWDDSFLDSLKRGADAIHRGHRDTLALLQIHHGGRACPQELVESRPISPSAIAAERPGAMVPREMSQSEIMRSLDDYAFAAERAMRAGFDGVEIHGANTYLIQQFVSPQSNRRTDHWNSADLRFSIELTQRVRDAVGAHGIVGYRFSPEEPETPGIRLDLTDRLLDELIATSSLDYLHVSLRRFDQTSLHGPERVMRRVAKTIGQRLPLIGVGEIRAKRDVTLARAEGADHYAVGRAAISDPNWAFHVEQNRPTQTKLPRENWAKGCQLPAGLARKIESTPGWLEFEDQSEPDEAGVD